MVFPLAQICKDFSPCLSSFSLCYFLFLKHPFLYAPAPLVCRWFPSFYPLLPSSVSKGWAGCWWQPMPVVLTCLRQSREPQSVKLICAILPLMCQHTCPFQQQVGHHSCRGVAFIKWAYTPKWLTIFTKHSLILYVRRYRLMHPNILVLTRHR